MNKKQREKSAWKLIRNVAAAGVTVCCYLKQKGQKIWQQLYIYDADGFANPQMCLESIIKIHIHALVPSIASVLIAVLKDSFNIFP